MSLLPSFKFKENTRLLENHSKEKDLFWDSCLSTHFFFPTGGFVQVDISWQFSGGSPCPSSFLHIYKTTLHTGRSSTGWVKTGLVDKRKLWCHSEDTLLTRPVLTMLRRRNHCETDLMIERAGGLESSNANTKKKGQEGETESGGRNTNFNTVVLGSSKEGEQCPLSPSMSQKRGRCGANLHENQWAKRQITSPMSHLIVCPYCPLKQVTQSLTSFLSSHFSPSFYDVWDTELF